MSEVRFKTKVEIDTVTITEKIEQKCKKVQPYLDSIVMQDSNYFCPLKTGKLQQSAIINSHIGSGVLVWRTPYARRQYYGEKLDHSKQLNPSACSKWFEAAKARWLDKWVRFVNERIKRS